MAGVPTHVAVTARTPVRACDAGGWTDTWFAGHGTVCTLAVGPAVTVTVALDHEQPAGTVALDVPSFGDRYAFTIGDRPGRHPLLEATIARHAGDAAAAGLRVTTSTLVPPGSGLGTSASVVVALVGALRALDGSRPDPATVARAAHDVETVELGWQSGVQDQLACAHGGALHLAIDTYPDARVTPINVPASARRALTDRLVTVYLGRPHASSALHDEVIASLGDTASARLEPLRRAAQLAAGSLSMGDLEGWAEALTDATEGQRALHTALVSAAADDVWRVASAHGALGWKVNGAGGDGGTVTVLASGDRDPAELRAALAAADQRWRVLDLRPTTDGLVVTTSSSG